MATTTATTTGPATQLTFSSQPDPNFYDQVVQHPDLSWTAVQRPLTDTTYTNPMLGDHIDLGVRSRLKLRVDSFANNQIASIAPTQTQVAANTTIAQLGALPPASLTPVQSSQLAAAQALTNKIQATNNFAHQVKMDIDNILTFDDALNWQMPVGWPPVV